MPEVLPHRTPITTSACPIRTGSTARGMSFGLCWWSPSRRTKASSSFARAYSHALRIAIPLPRFRACRMTWAPARVAVSAVSSVDPSSTTTTSLANCRVFNTTEPIVGPSLNAGIATTTFGCALESSGRWLAVSGYSMSATDSLHRWARRSFRWSIIVFCRDVRGWIEPEEWVQSTDRTRLSDPVRPRRQVDRDVRGNPKRCDRATVDADRVFHDLRIVVEIRPRNRDGSGRDVRSRRNEDEHRIRLLNIQFGGADGLPIARSVNGGKLENVLAVIREDERTAVWNPHAAVETILCGPHPTQSVRGIERHGHVRHIPAVVPEHARERSGGRRWRRVDGDTRGSHGLLQARQIPCKEFPGVPTLTESERPGVRLPRTVVHTIRDPGDAARGVLSLEGRGQR